MILREFSLHTLSGITYKLSLQTQVTTIHISSDYGSFFISTVIVYNVSSAGTIIAISLARGP